MFDKDSFILGLLFALIIVFLLYYIVKSVKQDRYIRHLESILDQMQRQMFGKDFEQFMKEMEEKINNNKK